MDSLVKRDTVNGRPAYSIKTDNGLPELITPGHAFYSLIAKLCEYEEAVHSGSLLNHNSSQETQLGLQNIVSSKTSQITYTDQVDKSQDQCYNSIITLIYMRKETIMGIILNDEQIRIIVQEETNKAVRKRMREMQGDYTSKAYLEDIMRRVLWETVSEKIPDLESFVRKTISEAVASKKSLIPVPSKSEIIDAIIEKLRDDDD